ncbi:MAG: hypothetical protein ACNI25_02025 [Halarcobacter sp.]
MLDKIKNLEFKYYDVNGYIYPFVMLDGTKEKIGEDEYSFDMVCTATNLSANGSVFLRLKIIEDEVYFRTNYFANSTEYTKLKKIDENNYNVDFNGDTLELKVILL